MSDGITEMWSEDRVNHPSHYNRGSVECVDAIESVIDGMPPVEAYHTASAIKYIWRWHFKNGIEDLRKARWHINRLIGD